MEDDKIKLLFQDFQPGLSSDFDFIRKLERNLNSVEIVREQSALLRRRSKRAVIIAAIVGFVTGFLASFLVPYFGNIVSEMQLSMPDSSAMKLLVDYQMTFAWVIVGSLSLIMSYNAYDITQAISLNSKAR